MTHTTERVAAIREAFDARAPEYDTHAMHRALAASVAGFARVADDGAVLDVATGTGLVARELARLHPRVSITGVDVSGGMLAVARAALPEAEWLESDAADVPVAAASMDLITCVTALHLFADPARAISEWARVLRPGGRIVTATFTSGGHGSGAHGDGAHGSGAHGSGAHGGGAHGQGHREREHPYPRDHASFATPDRLQSFYTPLGLRIVRLATWVRADDRVLIAEAVLA